MGEITVRFVGTACFIDRRDSRDDFDKRLVLPTDNEPDPKKRHIPYVEFLAKDVVSGSNLSDRYTHRNGDVQYQRFDLSGHTIDIPGIVDSPGLLVMESFREHIPKMTEVATLAKAPRDECFLSSPPVSLIGGHLDLTRGRLKAGPLYEYRTVFEKASAPGVPVYSIHAAAYSELLLSMPPGRMRMTFTNSIGSVTIVLGAETDFITIGNYPLSEILDPGTGDDVTAHFKLYYELASDYNKPQDPPLPRKYAAINNACTNTTWP
jgi:hypothetical protein